MTTLTSALQDYILSGRADGKRESTVNWYRSILGRFTATRPNILLKAITTNAIREYIMELRRSTYAEETVNDHIRALHTFFAWCSAEYGIPQKMHGRIKYPEPPQSTPKVARIEDVQAMFEVAGEGDIGIRNRAILMFMLDTGCRAAGVCDLRVSDLDIPGRRAFVTEKGNKTRAVIFTALTAKLLRDWMRVRDTALKVFYNIRTLMALTTSGLYQLFMRLGEEAGVEGHCHPHSFRHLFATSYLLRGGDNATLSKLLGHRDISTTLNTIFRLQIVRRGKSMKSTVRLPC
jgi:site-specific recombinase XerD